MMCSSDVAGCARLSSDLLTSLLASDSVCLLRNVLFDEEYHGPFLEDPAKLFHFVMLPLIGPEDLPDDDTEGMPEDFQMQLPSKTRESDAAIRKILLDIVLILLTTRSCREKLRAMKIYPLIREYHGFETAPQNLAVVDEIVQLLARDESEQ